MKFLPFVLLSALCMAAQPDLKQIMADPAWIGRIPNDIAFGDDPNKLYFSVDLEQPKGSAWYVLNLKNGSVSEIDESDRPWVLAGPALSNGAYSVYRVSGDLWVKKGKGPLKPLISKSGGLTPVRFIGEHLLIFRDGSDLYSLDLSSGATIQLTQFVFGTETEDKDSWYINEEKAILKYVEQRHQEREYDEARSETFRHLAGFEKPKQSYLGKGYSVGFQATTAARRSSVDISNDQRFVAIVLSPEDEGDSTDYAEFINTEAKVRARSARPKVGHETKPWKLGILDRSSWEVKWLDTKNLPEIETDRLQAIKDGLPESDKKYLPKTQEGPRPVSFVPGGFQPGGDRFLVTAFSRDYKDKWVLLLDPATMEYEVADHQYDEAWVQNFLNSLSVEPFVTGAAFWRADGKQLAFLSDVSGYQHLYAYDVANKERIALTSGEFEVYNPYEGSEGKYWYFHSNKVHPGETHFYRMPVKGGAWTALTKEEGRHLVRQSPSGDLMVDLFTRPNHPSILRVNDGKNWRTAYDGRSEAFKAVDWVVPELITYTNRDGKQVHARLYKPEKPNGAGVVFVHGAGYLQNAHKGWSGYFREYMFHNLLLREGYTVLDPDFQASAGYGRDWRTAIYRHMGGKDLTDVLDGAEFLVKEHGVERDRLGVYGGSYGGFITFMAMFNSPDTFACGAALRPVTDWSHYNHWYTARILNTPTSDPEAYRKSSPIYFAEGLKGHLLICHGMVDSNVQYQDSIRLVQKLMELGKKNWELSSYPVEGHGFSTPWAWYDEYRRIHELFQEHLSK